MRGSILWIYFSLALLGLALPSSTASANAPACQKVSSCVSAGASVYGTFCPPTFPLVNPKTKAVEWVNTGSCQCHATACRQVNPAIFCFGPNGCPPIYSNASCSPFAAKKCP